MKHLILIVSMIVFASCLKTEDSVVPLGAYYSLSRVSCECHPIEIIPHQQQWLFDFDKSEINVRTFGKVKSHLVLDAGIYKFELIRDGIINRYDSTDLFIVDGHAFGFLQNSGSIILSSGFPHGIEDSPDYIFVEN